MSNASATAAAPNKTARVAVTNGEPTLLVSTTSNYNWIYDDKGSGSDMDVTIYRPAPTTDGYFIIGDYAQGDYSSPTGSSLIVMAVNDNPSSPLLAAPVKYEQVWNDKKSGGDNDGSVWRPVAPDGYLALGFVANNGYDQPNIPNYRCLRKDLVEDTTAGGLIWNDKGSGASMDVSLYVLTGVAGSFVAQGNYNPYTGPAYKIVNG